MVTIKEQAVGAHEAALAVESNTTVSEEYEQIRGLISIEDHSCLDWAQEVDSGVDIN